MSRLAFLLVAIALLAVGCSTRRSAKESRVSAEESRLVASADAPDDDDEVEIPLDQVPKAVLDAAKEAVPGIEVSRASREVEDGETIFEVQGKADGTMYEVEVNATGTVVEVEKGDDDDGDHDDDD